MLQIKPQCKTPVSLSTALKIKTTFFSLFFSVSLYIYNLVHWWRYMYPDTRDITHKVAAPYNSYCYSSTALQSGPGKASPKLWTNQMNLYPSLSQKNTWFINETNNTGEWRWQRCFLTVVPIVKPQRMMLTSFLGRHLCHVGYWWANQIAVRLLAGNL